MRTLEELRCALVVDEGAYIDEARAVVRDLIAHVARQAEQIATLTARVEALEASEAERAIDRMVARRTGPGRPMVSAGKVQTPAKLVAPADYEARARAWLGDDAPTRLGPDAPAISVADALQVPSLAALLQRVADEARCEQRSNAIRRAGLGHSDREARAVERAREWLRDHDGAETAENLAALLLAVEDDAVIARMASDAADLEAARREERDACEAVCRSIAKSFAADGDWAKESAAHECADRIAARGSR